MGRVRARGGSNGRHGPRLRLRWCVAGAMRSAGRRRQDEGQRRRRAVARRPGQVPRSVARSPAAPTRAPRHRAAARAPERGRRHHRGLLRPRRRLGGSTAYRVTGFARADSASASRTCRARRGWVCRWIIGLRISRSATLLMNPCSSNVEGDYGDRSVVASRSRSRPECSSRSFWSRLRLDARPGSFYAQRPMARRVRRGVIVAKIKPGSEDKVADLK